MAKSKCNTRKPERVQQVTDATLGLPVKKNKPQGFAPGSSHV